MTPIHLIFPLEKEKGIISSDKIKNLKGATSY